MNVRAKVWFRETLTLGGYLRARLQQSQTWYYGESLGMRLARRILRLPMAPLVERIRYGHVGAATGIRRRAYEQGLRAISQHPLPLDQFDPGFAADMRLLAEKFLLDHLFSKYEFHGMAAQFAQEHPDKDVVLLADRDLFPALDLSSPCLRVVQQRKLHWLHYLAGILVTPLYLIQLLRKHAAKHEQAPLQGKVLCEVDNMPVVEMFRDLLLPEHPPVFFIQPHYAGNFSADETSRLGLQVHGIGKLKRERLLRLTLRWLSFALRGTPRFATGGMLLFDFFKSLAQGILITPVATRCTYLTFEHMSTVKAVRNELLRTTGNTSVFVPFNTYAIDHFFVPEFQYNYDVLCSPCELLERVYRMQQAVTPVVLKTGAYSPHRQVPPDSEASMRQARLAAFKGSDIAITILSAGVGVETVSGEHKLLALARELASLTGVKVFIRQKPTTPEPCFAGLYSEGVANQPNIMLTHAEYKLFDFLPVTDLFITSISSSAVDLCGAGADFFAVDFWQDRDLYLWQTEVEGVFLTPEQAADIIMGWVADRPSGARTRHRARMNALRSLIAYDAGSFQVYRNRFLAHLAPWLPTAKPTEKVMTVIERTAT